MSPQHAILLTAIHAYEHFCRLLTDAFAILRNTASCGDTTGCSLDIVEQDKQFVAIAASDPRSVPSRKRLPGQSLTGHGRTLQGTIFAVCRSFVR